jgi:peptidylprolyl isomerase
LEFTLGGNQVISGFDEAVAGMNLNETKTVTIAADKAYSPHNPEMVATVGKDQFPEHLKPEVGQQLQMRQAESQTIVVTVTDISESDVTLDANHPLAGKDLSFDIQLVEIV